MSNKKGQTMTDREQQKADAADLKAKRAKNQLAVDEYVGGFERAAQSRGRMNRLGAGNVSTGGTGKRILGSKMQMRKTAPATVRERDKRWNWIY